MIQSTHSLDDITAAIKAWYNSVLAILAKARGQAASDTFKTLRFNAMQAREKAFYEFTQLQKIGEKHQATSELNGLLVELPNAHVYFASFLDNPEIDPDLKGYCIEAIHGGRETDLLANIKEYFGIRQFRPSN